MIEPLLNMQNLGQAKGDDTIQKVTNLERQKEFRSELDQKMTAEKKAEKPKDRKLWETCVEFESIYVSRMFNEMRKTVHKGDILHGGRAEEIFEDFLYDEYAKMTSKNSNLGIAKMLYNQLS